VAITVEGANILTRSLIIFGQGAVRCHPFVLKEMEAARNPDRKQGLADFDSALLGHIGFTLSNAVRSFIMALTNARFTKVPAEGPAARYYQHIVRFSASFAFAVDVAMLSLGGYLKKKENLSARLGDVLSYMYLASMVLKHYENQGRRAEDLPIVEWACRDLLYKAQEQLHAFLRNFPNRLLGGAMRFFIFPRGLQYSAPGDRLSHTLAELVTAPTEVRDRLCYPVFRRVEANNPLGLLQEALEMAGRAEELDRRIRVEGVKTGRIQALDLPGQIDEAERIGLLAAEDAAWLRDYDRKVMELIHVDDFATHELGTNGAASLRVNVQIAADTPAEATL
jgi:acyl-CoA dehydrogenase